MRNFVLILCSVLLTGISARDPRCPLDPNDPPYFAHETDCQLYYQCDAAGNANQQQCELGTEFHPELFVSSLGAFT